MLALTLCAPIPDLRGCSNVREQGLFDWLVGAKPALFGRHAGGAWGKNHHADGNPNFRRLK
jgi:hypothetical protein